MKTNQSTLAIAGGTPVRDTANTWPSWPVYDERERTALLEVLESGTWFYGERVKAFEQAYASFQGATYCITCNSGTAAAEIILQALGIGPGDEVLVPPYTFVATASAVLRVGAIPVFVDVDDTWCMDPDLVEAAVTARTKAIMPVHFGGRFCDMDKLTDIAAQYNLAVIEDACHCWGGQWEGRGAGTLGCCGFFSFQASKNITAGEGGAIVTNDKELAEKLRSRVNCGRPPSGTPWYHHVNVGTNARMTEFQAAVLSCQLERMEEHMLLRARNAAQLNHVFESIAGLTPQQNSNRNTRRSYHLYCIRFDEAVFGCSRDQFVRAANAEGWPVTAGYPLPLYKQPVFLNYPGRDYSACTCPVAEDLCYKSGLWFAHHLLLGSEQDMKDILVISHKIKSCVKEL